MLRVLLLLGWLGRLWAAQNSERLLVEVTVPVKMRSVVSEGLEVEVSYKVLIEGKIFILNLTQKTFLPHNFRVYGYNGTEIMKPFDEAFQNFCYYQGYIEDYPNSMVILSTCNGIRGILQFENISYGIEPLESSIGFEHVIYRVNLKNADIALYAIKDIESRDMSYKIKSIEPQPDLSQYIEMHVVVEKQLYDHMGSDTAVVTQKVFQLIGLTNAIFTSFNTTVILSSLELWTDENKILTTGDANELLHRFLKWKRSYLVLRPHDVAFLLTYREKSNYVGATFQGKMCDRNYGGGIVMHPRAISMESLAVILAQLLSLSMGITYDDTNKCQCSGTICIMNPEAIHFSGVKMFSNCSMEDFAHFISKQKSQCLQNQPRLDPSYKQDAVCGNEKVEPGEDCDCGDAETCANAAAQCCNSETCQFAAGANCAEGPCCENCRYKGKSEPQSLVLRRVLESLILRVISQETVVQALKDTQSVKLNDDRCIALEYPHDDAQSAIMWVKDGTVCAANKVCNNKVCVDSSFLDYDCTAQKCSNHGVCNNKKNCHCNAGFLPPNCQTEDASWPGGSVDSGNYPPAAAPSVREGRYIESGYHQKPTRWPFFLLIPFFIILCVLIAMLVKVRYQRKKWKTEDYASDEQLEHEDESKE
ncbi:disintegrin and metalloproteinase domain-containing protein 2 isoform X3 [Microcebus murinus]|uniref:disintegrin and metalloproteinase domain-containing protein 2-like isoform X3 n=1 Tax=Microcebus murinus TaxID=30608 RepID=UPI003F6BBD76